MQSRNDGQPLVSVIIPCLDAERTLTDTIRSCLAQSWRALEIIVVDNGSRDRSVALAKSLACETERAITVIACHERGANPARAAGFDACRGDYVRWLDADDSLSSDVVERQVLALQSQPRFDIAYCDWLWRQHCGQPVSEQDLARMPLAHQAIAYGDRQWSKSPLDATVAEAKFQLKPYDDFLLRLLEDKWIAPHAYLLRRHVAQRLIALQAFHPQRSVAQDREFFSIAALLGYRFCYVPGPHVIYNAWSQTQITQRVGAAERASQLEAIFVRLREFAQGPAATRLSSRHRVLLALPRGARVLAPGSAAARRTGAGRYVIERPGYPAAYLSGDDALVLGALRGASAVAPIEDLAKRVQHREPRLWERHTTVVDSLQRLEALGLLFDVSARSTQARAGTNRHARVLIVTDVPFWAPGRGDAARIRALVDYLEGSTDLSVFVIAAQAGPTPTLSKGMLPLQKRESPAWIARASHLPVLQTMLAQVAAQQASEVCIFEYLRLGGLRAALPGTVRTLVDTHDLSSARAQSFRGFGAVPPPGPEADEEYSALSRFDGVMLIQNEDHAAAAARLGPQRCILVPHPAEIERIEIRERARRVGFVASEYLPNVDGLNWFLHEVWPSLAQRDVELHIYGNVGNHVDVAGARNIVAHGLVDDLHAAYRSIDIAINPVRFGAGLKIKTVEALACGLPLVTSREGAKGLVEHAGKAFLLAETADDFIAHSRALLGSTVRRCELSNAAHQLAATHFTPQACFGSLSRWINSES